MQREQTQTTNGARPDGQEARVRALQTRAAELESSATRQVQGASTTAAAGRGYYGLPVLKRPHWKWEIVLYFWMGGIAAGAYVISAIADIFGDEHDRPIVRAGRFIALPLMILSPILLIKDLGRPEKFYNMLRIFKAKSPMSVGTWGLTFFGGFVGLSALLELLTPRDTVRTLRRVLAILGTPFGFFVGGYTGVLLAATAIPIWFRNRLLWGPTFLASAFSTGAAAIQAALAISGRGGPHAHAKLEQAHMVGLATEAALMGASLARMGSAGRPLTTGKWSTLFVPGALGLGIVAPLLLGLRRGEAGRGHTLLSALCTLLGGLIFRLCIVYVGKDSADDAQAYFEMTRGRDGRGA
jgi:formate-dependent nitrite reductase membrane component NrfD